MEGNTLFKCCAREVNTVIFRIKKMKSVFSSKDIATVVKRLQKSRRNMNSVTFKVNLDKWMRSAGKYSKMKTLGYSSQVMDKNVEDTVNYIEESLSSAIRRGCGTCSSITPPSASTEATTHGSDLPLNIRNAYRWIAIPNGSKNTVVEQKGKYEGTLFVPSDVGQKLSWTSIQGKSTHTKSCCLLNYIDRQNLKGATSAFSDSSRFIESISLKLETESVKSNRKGNKLTNIEREKILAAVIF